MRLMCTYICLPLYLCFYTSESESEESCPAILGARRGWISGFGRQKKGGSASCRWADEEVLDLVTLGVRGVCWPEGPCFKHGGDWTHFLLSIHPPPLFLHTKQPTSHTSRERNTSFTRSAAASHRYYYTSFNHEISRSGLFISRPNRERGGRRLHWRWPSMRSSWMQNAEGIE